MPRRSRSFDQDGWHHVTNRGLDRRAVFRSQADRVDFGRLIASGHLEFGVDVLAYCLMDNHFHLVLHCPDGGLSPFMQHLTGKYTRHANERHGGDGPMFRGRFFSRAILSNGYLLNAVRYVHRNPNDIRPPVGLAEYRWSSHRTYLGLRPKPVWLSLSPVLDWFESPSSFDEFVRRRARTDLPGHVDADGLVRAVEQVVDEMSATLDRAPQGVLRSALYLAVDQVDGHARAGLVERLNPSSERALKQAIWRARRLDVAQGICSEVLERALDLVVPGSTLCLTQPETQSQAGRFAS